MGGALGRPDGQGAVDLQELQQSIQAWIDIWNQHPRPFVWARTADEILDTIAAYCQRSSDSDH
jgi:hypothetical protein